MQMFTRRALVGATLATFALLSSGLARAEDLAPAVATQSHYGAIFQIDSGSPAAIKKTINNIENLLHDPRLKGKMQIELIANAQGFAAYVKNNGFEQKLQSLQQQGVLLAQCANTLRELHVDRKDLYPFITVVPSGMGEITIREAQGWAYIHPSAPNPGL
jgi:intracellular sulfur oxidation DsrE/DsrF family protein